MAAEMLRREPDPAAPTVSIGDAQRLEGNGGAPELAFVVTLSAPLSKPVTVRYSTGNGTALAGSDYVQRAGTLMFAPGTTALFLCVPILPDAADEADETLRVNLNPSDESAAGVVIVDGEGVGTIVDDEGVTPVLAPVLGRHVFYNHSAFDGNNPAATPADDAAVAPDKEALLAGLGAATFANVTSYARGLNGIMIDMGRVPAGATPDASDFTSRTGTGADPAAWTPVGAGPGGGPGADPSVSIRRGAGVEESDRVTVTFPDGAVRNAWLQVTILPGDRTGLGAPHTFYFGNQAGDSGEGNLSTAARVNATDVAAVKRNFTTGSVPITSACDFNRDGKVNALDLATSERKPDAQPPAVHPARPGTGRRHAVSRQRHGVAPRRRRRRVARPAPYLTGGHAAGTKGATT